MSISVSTPWPLFDRADEIEVFRGALFDERQHAFFIHGHLGMGKTRLAEECMEIASREGRRCLRAVASDVARAVPLGALGHLLPAQDGPANPVALFAQTMRQYGRPGEGECVVLLVDDVHLLDPTSAVLVGGLVDAGHVFLIATVRSGAMVPDVIAGIGSSDRSQRADLTELTLAQVDGLLRLVLGGLVDAGACFRLHQASGGVPLFLRELVCGALEAGTLVGDGGVWRLLGAPAATPMLAELIEYRLAAVTADDRAVLEAIALCGQLPALGLDDEVLTRLESCGLIEIRADERRTEAVVAHPLYAEVIRGTMPLLQRRERLVQQADRLRATAMRRREDRWRQAMWLLDATGTAEPSLLRDAAQLARYASDFESVARLATALTRFDPGAGPRMLLGEALYELGCFGEADAMLREAAEAACDDDEYLLVTLLRTQSLAFAALRLDDAMAVNADARRKLTSRPAQDALRVDQIALLSFGSEVARATPLLAGLGDADDPRTRAMGAIPHAQTLVDAGRIADSIAVADAGHAEHQSMDAVIAAAHPSLQLAAKILALTEAGHIGQARDLAEQAYGHAVADHALIARVWLGIALGKVEYSAGQMSAAHAWFATAAAIAADHNFRSGQWMALIGIALSAAGMADTSAARAASERASELSPAGHRRADTAAALSWTTAAEGNLSAARDMLGAAANLARTTGSRTTEAMLLCDIARLGDPARVRDRLHALAAQTDSAFTAARAAFVAALARRDPRRLERVADSFENMGALLLAAEACANAARLHQEAGDSRLAAAAGVRSGQLAGRCNGARTPALSLPDSKHILTPREREIAMLAVTGQSSKEIAEQLVVSTRTVDSHLQHIYQKTGVKRRKDLRKALGVQVVLGFPPGVR